VLSQAKHFEVTPPLPLGIRLWEQWTINSRDPIDSKAVGSFENMTVWCESEGVPGVSHALAVLRPGQLVGLDSVNTPQAGMSWAGQDSFRALTPLCTGFLRWDRFSVRAMKPRAVFEWEPD